MLENDSWKSPGIGRGGLREMLPKITLSGNPKRLRNGETIRNKNQNPRKRKKRKEKYRNEKKKRRIREEKSER